MIRHIVFFSAANPEDVERIRDGLMMLADIPHSSHFEVGRNLQSDALTGSRVDLVVYAEFSDETALAAYKAHPIYADCITRVRPLRELRIAADFKAG
ncbi:Stress responsive A/B Barrel Domain [Roseovarius azorensis]|uniref:Stress responsive A/B Barrel Domain n=1 Tax=Roseovarius azorensis TaxID=1287727 RepID=A0A1H7GMJ0_9RHOB|nr:Dabb family protein [Roseovarius azorensis]SEK39321.1 Stress responsive A/B Barrel Domain [Roseovarius azorensis]